MEKMSEDARDNQGLFRYVITSNGAQVTDIVEKRELFRENDTERGCPGTA